jgi:hypothetical protein
VHVQIGLESSDFAVCWSAQRADFQSREAEPSEAASENAIVSAADA